LNINLSRRNRVAIGTGTIALVVAGLVASVNGSLAYFSDTQQGNLTGSVGSIKGATNTNSLNFENLLPGEVQTVNAFEQNAGKNNQDVWVVFNNPDALHALNDLGTYGEFHINADGTSLFDSSNLNDNAGSCGPFGPDNGKCWPVQSKYKLASNVAPGGQVHYSFGFGYASKLSGQSPAGGGSWNSYPLSGPTSSGLPYQIVETQVGQQP
jgi:hypothetical protein